MTSKKHFTTVDIALASVFCALWVVLNLTVAPISFRLLGLPIVHDLITFFIFLIVAWATGKFGTTSFVGIVGATIVSAYFAGVLIGVLFMSGSLNWALTFWGVWHLIGGVIGIVTTLPVIAILEKANVRKIKDA